MFLEPIALSSLAADLPLLPFLALRDLFKSAPLQSDYGQSLRKDALEKDIIKLLLNHLGTLCSQETTKKEHSRKMLVLLFILRVLLTFEWTPPCLLIFSKTPPRTSLFKTTGLLVLSLLFDGILSNMTIQVFHFVYS